jgi:hypothetical protein
MEPFEDLNTHFQILSNKIQNEKYLLSSFRYETISTLKPIIYDKCRQFGVTKIDTNSLCNELVDVPVQTTMAALQQLDDNWKKTFEPRITYLDQRDFLIRYTSKDELQKKAAALIEEFEFRGKSVNYGKNNGRLNDV